MKIKVLQVIPSFATGGAEKLVLELSQFIDRDKFEIKIVSLYASEDSIYEQLARENNLQIIFLNKKKGFDIKVIIKLMQIMKKDRVDIVHTHLYVMSYALIASILARVKVRIHTVHNIASKEVKNKLKRIMKIGYKYLNVTPIAISDYIKQTILDEYKLNATRVPCIYNGIDTKKFKKALHKCQNEKIVELIHIGRFTEQKNHNLLIESFYEALKIYPNMKLKLIGDGELKESMELKVRQLGLNEKIDFLGIKKNTAIELSKSDIFILTSDWEGLPLSILEAMASGLPIISTNVGGVSDVVKHGENGIIVEKGNKQQLNKAIIELTTYNAERERMGENSIKYSSQYDITRMVKEYEQVYINYLKK